VAGSARHKNENAYEGAAESNRVSFLLVNW
jgi:hypothetical protein